MTRLLLTLTGCLLMVAMTLLGGCATTAPVPVAMKRALPQPPTECLEIGPAFPKVNVRRGAPVPPAASAQWAVQARRWADETRRDRAVCRTYARRMQRWR